MLDDLRDCFLLSLKTPSELPKSYNIGSEDDCEWQTETEREETFVS